MSKVCNINCVWDWKVLISPFFRDRRNLTQKLLFFQCKSAANAKVCNPCSTFNIWQPRLETLHLKLVGADYCWQWKYIVIKCKAKMGFKYQRFSIEHWIYFTPLIVVCSNINTFEDCYFNYIHPLNKACQI